MQRIGSILKPPTWMDLRRWLFLKTLCLVRPSMQSLLAVWITSEQLLYRFMGLPAVLPAATDPRWKAEWFLPDMAAPTTLEKIIDTIFERSTLVDKLIEKLFDSDAFKDAMKDYWSKEELRVVTAAEYASPPEPIPAGTVVMVKES